MFFVVAVISNMVLALRKIIQKVKESKFIPSLSKTHPIELKSVTETEESKQEEVEGNVPISFNNQAFNPEVINTKSFVIVTSLTISIMISIAVSFLAFTETAMNRFPIMQFLVRFILSVIIPLIIYSNNSSLVTYVNDFITTWY